MVSKEDYCKIKAYSEIGLPAISIAKKLDLHPVTVSKILKGGFKEMKKGSKLDQFKDYIVKRLENYPELTAISIFNEIKDLDYYGKESILRDYIRTIRPVSSVKKNAFETEPGEQFQVDWGQGKTVISGITTVVLAP